MRQQRTKVILPLAVASLDELLKRELRFPTIYCDPPWQYEFTASRAAAENYYRTILYFQPLETQEVTQSEAVPNSEN